MHLTSALQQETSLFCNFFTAYTCIRWH